MSASQRTKVERTCQACGKLFLADADKCKSRNVKYCSGGCYHASRRMTIEEQFRRGLSPVNEQGCILWAGGTDWGGRGVIYSTTRPPQRIFIASRIAWEVAHGPIPDGLCVLHNCPAGDNPLCVNVAHLFLGTQLENIADMVAKNRSPNRKFTPDEVRTIRRRYAKGDVSQQTLADEYEVHQTCISAIVHKLHYSNVT